MNRAELLIRLRADGRFDAAVERIGKADYGCEERAPDAPERVWVLLLRADGTEKSLELPEQRLTALGLAEGSLCRAGELESDSSAQTRAGRTPSVP